MKQKKLNFEDWRVLCIICSINDNQTLLSFAGENHVVPEIKGFIGQYKGCLQINN